MSSEYKNWREYQEAAARIFRKLGCSAEVEKPVRGARNRHKIDVYVTFDKFGYQCRWIIECKLTSRPVPKSDIHILYAIVQDIGADRGLIFCEKGFQSGARTAAKNTNILLHDSLEDFRRTAHLSMSRIPLLLKESDELDVPPTYTFPNGYRPHHLLKHDGKLFVSNWGVPQAGNIAVVNPNSRAIESIIELDRYEQHRPTRGYREVLQYTPGNMACADGKLFVGQVFSDVIIAIDIETQSIIRRIPIPGGGEGTIVASPDERHIYFASNRVPSLFIIDCSTYNYSVVDYPENGRGCLCILPHPYDPLLYIGVQRGGTYHSVTYPGGNSFLAVYDLARHCYIGTVNLALIEDGRSDNSTPVCLTYDEESSSLFVGMFQSLRGICRIDVLGTEIVDEVRFVPNDRNRYFPWVDPLSQALYGDKLLSVNRNNRELVVLDKLTGQIEDSAYLGDAPDGPHSVAVFGDTAIVSYPQREGLIFYSLADVSRRVPSSP